MMKPATTFLTTGILMTIVSCSSGNSGKILTYSADVEECNQKGVELLDEEKPDEALESFRLGLTDKNITKEMKAKTYRNIAVAFETLEEPDSAAHYLNLALTFIPKDSYEYLVTEADLDLLAENVPTATEKLERALAMDKEKVVAHDLLGEIYLGAHGKEYRELDKALEHNLTVYRIRKDSGSEFQLAKTYFLMDNLTDAYSHFDNLVVRYPNDEVYILHKAMVIYRQGDKAGAEKMFKKVIQANPDEKEYIEKFKEVYG